MSTEFDAEVGTPEQMLVPEPDPFRPVERQTISEQVRIQLARRIVNGGLAPGSQIPSERELSEQFQVARTSIREAIQGLMSLGLIERRGNRTHVTEHLPEVNVDDLDSRKSFVRELFETRRVLEAPIFGLAAERADSTGRTAVADLASKFDDNMDIAEFRAIDREFHRTIASLCGNPLLIELYHKVLERLFRSHEFDALLADEQNRDSVRRIVTESNDLHRSICSAFIAGDADAVQQAAAAHLASVEQAMVDDLQ